MWVPARAWMAALLAVAGVSPLPSAAAATSGGIASLTARPLPMAVDGGTLAEVRAHAVPFVLGSSALEGGIAAALDALLATAATDCFLFAQVVGHVQPGPAADGDTRAAHRLARARADAVAAALQRAGVPAGSVAATWDFGFSTAEPRATLWLFERAVGADCQGTPLPGAPPPPAVAAADPLEPAPGIHLPPPDSDRAQASVAAVGSSTVAAATRVGDGEPAPGIHVPEPMQAAASRAPATSASPPMAAIASAAGEPEIAAPEPQAGPADLPGSNTSPTAATLEVTFEPDSSYLSPAASAELDGWLRALPGDAPDCRIEVVAAVGDQAGRLQLDQARHYNEWLAERRQSRVVDRVRAHASCELRAAGGASCGAAARRVPARHRPADGDGCCRPGGTGPGAQSQSGAGRVSSFSSAASSVNSP